MNEDLTITNARIVLADAVIDGSLVVREGKIAAIETTPASVPGAVDFEGDYLLPGLIEMHTDNMEKHMVPRPGVHWPSPVGAALAHDTQVAGAGITTVFDAMSVGSYRNKSARKAMLTGAVAAVAEAREAGLMRADHLLHLRCEVSDPDLPELLDALIGSPLVRLISVMDHTPGQRQWRDLAKMKQFHDSEGMSDSELDAYVAERRAMQAQYADKHRRIVVELGRSYDLPMASHDDTTVEHVSEAVADDVMISEFPTTHEAAAAARARGMAIIMGAPNVVRGESHSGNISAIELAGDDLLDGLSSDYVLVSLLQAAFVLHHGVGLDLAGALAKVSANIAQMVGLDDRGEIAPGKRADLLRVKTVGGLPVVRHVWREGNRVI